MEPLYACGELTLLMVVGCTSALGKEKSQYLIIVFGGGSDIQRK